MSWDYADLSKQASAAGGPQALVNKIEEGGRQKGRDEMKPYIWIASATAAVITAVAAKTISYFKSKKVAVQIERGNAKAELIKGIEDYDNTHQDNEQALTQDKEDDEYMDYDEEVFDDAQGISVDEAALIWASNGKDEDYTYGYSEDELEDALK